MKYAQWNIPRSTPPAAEVLQDAGFSPLLAAVLSVRGFSDPQEAKNFLESSEVYLGDPLMMTDMPQAVMRLSRAIAAGEKVAVYGDYDVDGITSSCMLTSYLRSRGLECELYIPDRLEEGYGVNCGAIDDLKSRGVSLIITVDCGVTTVDEAAYASSIGMDMIITDHHECHGELPCAIAVVDPKRPDCNYPSHDLAGVGVAFKLLCALEGSAAPILSRYADLVAVGTIADVMPLVGENRYIVKQGLDKLMRDPRPGLRTLMEEAGLGEKKITATNIGFTLAPRLNASGRLGQVNSAVKLLLASTAREAAGHAFDLCQLNRDRQALEMDIWQQAVEMLGDSRPDAPIVLAQENWHQGVVGIAASRLTETYNVPAIMICLDGDKGKGSCRSCGGFNLFEALSACSVYLDGFGGHALAAGLTIRRENIDAFRAAIADYYRAHPAESTATLDIDLCVDNPLYLTMENVEDLEHLEPCGTGNPRAMLCMLGTLLTELSPIGGGKHLRLRLEKFGQSYEAVFFSHTAEELGIRTGDYLDIAFYPQINEFRSRRSVQLLISDLRRHDGTLSRSILSGIASEDAAAFLPERDDCGVVWRKMRALGGSLCAPVPALCELICPQMREEMLCLSLKIFEEVGLLHLEKQGRNLRVDISPAPEKADLESAPLLRQLRKIVSEKEGVDCDGKDL